MRVIRASEAIEAVGAAALLSQIYVCGVLEPYEKPGYILETLKRLENAPDSLKSQKWFRRYIDELKQLPEKKIRQWLGETADDTPFVPETLEENSEHFGVKQMYFRCIEESMTEPRNRPPELPIHTADKDRHWGKNMGAGSLILWSALCCSETADEWFAEAKEQYFIRADEENESSYRILLSHDQIPFWARPHEGRELKFLPRHVSERDGVWDPTEWRTERGDEYKDVLRAYVAMSAFLRADHPEEVERYRRVKSALKKFKTMMDTLNFRGQRPRIPPAADADEMEKEQFRQCTIPVDWARFMEQTSAERLTPLRVMDILNEWQLPSSFVPKFTLADAASDDDCFISRYLSKRSEQQGFDALVEAKKRFLPPPQSWSHGEQWWYVKHLIEDGLLSCHDKSVVEQALSPWEVLYPTLWLQQWSDDDGATQVIQYMLESINQFYDEFGPRYVMTILPPEFFECLYFYCARRIPGFPPTEIYINDILAE